MLLCLVDRRRLPLQDPRPLLRQRRVGISDRATSLPFGALSDCGGRGRVDGRLQRRKLLVICMLAREGCALRRCAHFSLEPRGYLGSTERLRGPLGLQNGLLRFESSVRGSPSDCLSNDRGRLHWDGHAQRQLVVDVADVGVVKGGRRASVRCCGLLLREVLAFVSAHDTEERLRRVPLPVPISVLRERRLPALVET